MVVAGSDLTEFEVGENSVESRVVHDEPDGEVTGGVKLLDCSLQFVHHGVHFTLLLH